MVAGGVGLAPFAALAEPLRRRRQCRRRSSTARAAPPSSSISTFFTALGVRLVLTTEDGSPGERGRIVAPLDRELAARPPAAAS